MRSSSCGKGWHKGQPVGQWNLPLRLFQVDKGTSATTTKFVYDGDNLAAEYNGSNAMTKRYYFGPGEDEPILEDTGGALNCSGTRFLHANQQGSIVALADCWGNRSSINSYDEYGIPGTANSGRFQYTGQAWLPELGMYYYKARIYSPTLGRFLQTDPIGYQGGVNLYAYVEDDPVNATDPTGLECTGSRIDAACDGGALATGRSGSSTMTPAEHASNQAAAAAGKSSTAQASHIGMNGLPQSGPAPQMMHDGDTVAMMQDSIEQDMVMQGQMTASEHRERQQARANGALTGVAALEGGLTLRAGARLFSKVVSVEGAGAAAKYGTGRIGQIRFGGGRLILRLDRPPRTGGVYHLNVESHTLNVNWHIPLNSIHWFGY